MEFDAFISYSSADKTAADAACAVLEGAGIRCWVAPRDISPGREYAAAIIDAIDRCRVTVLIFSSSANDSPQVCREVERAASKGVAIVPVRIEGVVPTKSMEYFLGDIHWLDAMTPPIEKHLQQLAVTVKALLNANAAAAGEPSSPGSRWQTGGFTPSYSAAQLRGGVDRFGPKYPERKSWLLPAIGGVVCVALLFGGAWRYQNRASKPMPAPSVAQPTESKPEPNKAQPLVPEIVPFISDRDRARIRNIYLPADDHKALAISLSQIGYTSGQADDDTAKAAALDNCRQATDAAGKKDFRCDLYALGNAVVYAGGHPPLPPEPWLVSNTSVERPFDAMKVPLVVDRSKTTMAKEYGDNAKPKALAISPAGGWSYVRGESPEEAIRRALEWCGRYGVPCMIVAVDDRFVVAIPTTMKVTGFFHANTDILILPELRSDVARRLRNATAGWSAVAVGTGGGPGLALGAVGEQAAIDGALADCGTRDRNCRVIAIGPFLVEPLPAKVEPLPQTAQLPTQRAPPAAQPPFVPLSSARERALQPRDSFKECDNCPEMVVVPAGSFIMGSPDTELGRGDNEGPQHKVTFQHQFAVGRFSVTFDEWDACVADGDCNGYSPPDQGWGRGRRPVINVSWNDVKTYLAWLSHKTGKTYRLLSEAEREYVARAGTTTPFWWGSSISTTQANYKGTETYGDEGVRGEFRNQSVPVDTFAPNPWGLYQVHGNVSEWTEDCRHDNYIDAPTDGSAWTAPNCNQHVRRGGSIGSPPNVLRATSRLFSRPADAEPFLGFRVARTLAP